MVMALAGNKEDLEDKRKVTTEQIHLYEVTYEQEFKNFIFLMIELKTLDLGMMDHCLHNH
ncbi:hypothetical protein Scep_029483 [Stephania cephalantha]|uniref:Uncharacterized protein n=1 Tax=Stephania cephalantha TaxID=152367 RepID=A0AAP0E290_9MAGN